MLIDMLHQIFRNKIYLENQVMWMFISCSNNDMYYLSVINE